jgi:hypothetical protein
VPFFLVALLYVAAGVAITAIELRRNGSLRADPIGIFILLVMLQLVIPGALIFVSLPAADANAPTGIPVFDHIYRTMDISVALVVWALTFLFVVFFYVGATSTRRWMASRFGTSGDYYVVHAHIGRMVIVLLLAFAISIVAFQSLGETVVERYVNLILLRSLESADRTALASNSLSLLQAWSWLTIIALFALADLGRRSLLLLSVLLMILVVFSVLGVSRRALFLPIVFAYLIVLMYDGRWRIGILASISVPIVLLVAFGEEMFGMLGFGASFEAVQDTYASASALLIRLGSEVGITVTESLGTIAMIDIAPRYGVDHLLSVARRFPEGLLGLDIEFPERVVRISTAAFSHRGDVDLPPGLLGQMWLDFRVFGPLIWGLVFGVQVGIVQHVFERTRRTLTATATFFVLLFIIALPLNSGSFDFSFSVDIIALVFAMVLCIRVIRTEGKSPTTLFHSRAPIG